MTFTKNLARPVVAKLIIASIALAPHATAAARADAAFGPSSSSQTTRAPNSAAGESAAAILGRVRELLAKGQSETALKRLDGDWGNQLKAAQAEPIVRLAKARILESLKRDSDAAIEYGKGLEKRSSFDTQIRFAAGKFYARTDRRDLARDSYLGILSADKRDVPSAMRVRTVLGLAQVMAEQATASKKKKDWRGVEKVLKPAMKSARGHDVYSSYIYLMVLAKREQGISDCRLARDLFSKFPAAAEISSWGPLMPNNRIAGEKLNCSATVKDIQTRLRRLQLYGQNDRVLTEIRELRAKGVFDEWTLDSFEIGAMLANGQNDDAIRLLMSHSEAHRGRPQFWNLFGRVASRLGDFTASSGAYLKAYDLAPRGRAASDALFNSAFASYQMQDYDGAEKTFSMLSARYGRSKIARDARWHLAWMSYLRGDFETALERWQGLLKERKGRRAPRGDATSPDRIQYWSAMALLRLGKNAEAVETLRELVRDPSIDYYAILAWYRLKSIPGVQLTEAESRLGFKRVVAEQELKETMVAEALDSTDQVTKAIVADAASVAEVEGGDEASTPADVEADTEPEVPTAATTEPPADGDAATDPVTAAAVEAVMPPEASTAVRDPALQRRLDRVRLLYALGLNEETRWELQNLDSQVRHPQDRRVMMTELHRMGRWDRSSTMGELAFSGPRLRGGIDGARDLWEYAYPKAWPDSVQTSAKAAGVEEEIVWSIMRAESHYRADARSPVGASGLMQIMPFTGERVSSQLLGKSGFHPSDLLDPDTNVRFGARYLQRLSEKFGSMLPLVAASYNAGPHRVQTWLRGFGALRMDEFIEHIPFVETRNYVKKVARNYQIYRLLYRDDRGTLGWLVKPVGVTPDTGPNALEVW